MGGSFRSPASQGDGRRVWVYFLEGGVNIWDRITCNRCRSLVYVSIVPGADKVIYQQAVQVVRERNYYYQQIQAYKQKYPKYQGLFPEYNDQGFWKKFK